MSTLAVVPHISLIPPDASKDVRSRVGKYERWLNSTGRDVLSPALASYRDHLLAQGLKPSTVSGQLSTIRARYRSLLTDNGLRDALRERARVALVSRGEEANQANVKAMVDEVVQRIENGIDPSRCKVAVEIVHTRVDGDYGIRLNRDEGERLLASPGFDTLKGIRDTAILALMLCTGIRERELSNLDVVDLYQEMGGKPCLHIRHGKGNKTRAVPYGPGIWCLSVVEKWMEGANIEEGAVFRGFYKGGRIREGRLSVRAIQYVVNGYPVVVKGSPVTIAPHDLRRTYARRAYDEGMDIVGIQQNLGHADLRTTLKYVGVLDVDVRTPPVLFSPDLQKGKR